MQTEALSSPPLARKIAPIIAPARRSEFLLWTVLSGIYTAIIIQYSLHYGKLAAPPFYDDVAYFMDALARLRDLYTHDWAGVIGGLLHRPPHSAFSTVLAMLSYLVFGAHDWAPYAGNAVIILALATILNIMARGLPLWMRLMLFLLALALPISQNAVNEFRPDIASALCAAAGAALILSRPLSAGSWHQRVGAGVMFGLSMVIKTPTFPLTSVLFATSLGVALLAEFLLNRPAVSARSHVVLVLQPMLAALVIMLPVYVPQFRDIIGYIYEPIFGKTKDLWASHMTFREHALYYLTGEGGQNMLGKLVYLLIGIIVGGFALALVRGRTDVIVMLAGFVSATLVSYAIPTIMHVKQPFFGTTFDWMLIFCAVYVLLWIARSTPAAVGGSALVAAALYAVLTTHFIPMLYMPEGENLISRRRVIYALYDAMNQQHIRPQDRVYITTTGYVNAAVLDYLNMLKFLPQFNIQEQPFSGDIKLHTAEIHKAAYVIASEQGNSEAYGDFIPSGNMQDETLAVVRADPDLVEVAAVPTLTPKRYFLFKRVGPFFGWTGTEGLGPMEGPYPAWKLGEVRWALGPRTIVTMPDVTTEGDDEIIASAKAAVAGATMTIRIDGKPIGSHHFTDDTTFDAIDIPLHLSSGHHQLELTYSDWSKKPGLQMAVLFKTMKLAPATSTTRPISPMAQPAAGSAKQ